MQYLNVERISKIKEIKDRQFYCPVILLIHLLTQLHIFVKETISVAAALPALSHYYFPTSHTHLVIIEPKRSISEVLEFFTE